VATLEAEHWLSPSQSARQLNLSLSRVRQLTTEGRLRHVVTPLGKLIAAEDVARLVAERAARQGAPQ
jgi:hypothetical protein